MGVISDGRTERLTATYIGMGSQVLSTSSSRTMQLGSIADCKTFRPQRSSAVTKLKLKRKVSFYIGTHFSNVVNGQECWW